MFYLSQNPRGFLSETHELKREPLQKWKAALGLFFLILSFSFFVFADELSTLDLSAGENRMISNDSEAKEFAADQVILEENSTLVLSDFKSIHIQKLIAKDGARIRLAANANGGDGAHSQKGENGANSKFFLGQIDGHILIEARGGRGGDGRAGRNGRQGVDGLDGRAGRTLLFGLIYIGDGDDGQSGSSGENGEDGEDGGAGGNGGHIALFYREKSADSKIFIDVNGGEGGRGGAGGIGGLGGNGGRGGHGIHQGAQGAMGVSGKSGRPGMPAAPGRPGEAVVYQLDQNLFQCLFTLDLRSYDESLSEADFDECRNLEGAKELKASMVLATSVKKSNLNLESIDPIVLLSADGARGEDAIGAHLTGSTPPSAAMGAAGGEMTLLVRDLPERIALSARGGNGGQGAQGAMGSKGRDGANGRDETWFRKGTAGENGENGGDAGNGSDGGVGASGGHIRVVYFIDASKPADADWPLHFNYDISGGVGGKGGDAGIGGRGGQGGVGGKISSKKRYADGAAGIRGRDGHQGRDGEVGADGLIEFFEADSYQNWVVSEYQRYLDNLSPNRE